MTMYPDTTKHRLPVELQGLPVIRAEVACTIADGRPFPSLEGPVFDRSGNFYCCHTAPGDTHVMKITPDGTMSEFFHSTIGMTVGLCFHRDGRCFTANMNAGCIQVLDPQGTLLEEIPAVYQGDKLRPDCMVFHHGDLYFTDLRGSYHRPLGGVYCMTQESGYHTVTRVLDGLESPDGITVAPDGKSLWIAECSSNSLLRYLFGRDGKLMIMQHTPVAAFRNSGACNVDTHAMDEKGNIYLGIMMAGRAVVLDPDGIPAASIIVPGFEEGKLRYTPNLALKPDAREGYLLASDAERAVVLRFPTLAPGQKLYAFE